MQIVATWIANKYYFEKLGKIKTLKIDSENEQVFLELDLKGESTTVEMMVHYRIVNPTLIEIVDVRSSREWMATLANEILPVEQKQITVPKTVTVALSQLIR